MFFFSKLQLIKEFVDFEKSWKDYNLVWEPEEFDNISRIRIPVEKIWTPDILLYNSADSTFDSTSKVNAVIDFTGDVR